MTTSLEYDDMASDMLGVLETSTLSIYGINDIQTSLALVQAIAQLSTAAAIREHTEELRAARERVNRWTAMRMKEVAQRQGIENHYD